MKLKQLLSENFETQISQAQELVKRSSYFELDDMKSDSVSFTTRKNGSVASETASQIDIKEGQKLRDVLKAKFKDAVVKLEVVDEWVIVSVDWSKTIVDKVLSSRLPIEELDKIAKDVQNYVVEHLKTNLPYLRDKEYVGFRFPGFEKKNEWTGDVRRYFGFYTHKFEVDLIDTDIPRATKVKAFDKYVQKLKKDLFKEFKLSRFVKDKYNTKFDVIREGGGGSWMYITVYSPYTTTSYSFK